MDLEIEDEATSLTLFSKRVADLDQNNDTLIRFLRARDGNVDKAEDMLRKSMKWREDNNVSSYRSYTPRKALADDFVFQCLGSSKSGYPVLYIPLGRWNLRDRIEDGYLQESFDFRFYFLENVVIKFIQMIKQDQIVLIIDMAELSFYKVAHMNTMNVITKCCQDFDANYPERLRTSFVINAPWTFPYAFSIVKPWIAKKTLSKIHIFDSNKSKWLPTIEKDISIDILPKQILS